MTFHSRPTDDPTTGQRRFAIDEVKGAAVRLAVAHEVHELVTRAVAQDGGAFRSREAVAVDLSELLQRSRFGAGS